MTWTKYLDCNRLRDSEREKQNDPRNEFESDFGRVIFSPATRRMHDKTQVIPLTIDDNIHTRLTHSMEVMSIGNSLGLRLSEKDEFLEKSGLDKIKILREIPVILKSVCLVHDIGNPPFGHFGEDIIQNYFQKLFAKNKFGLSEIEQDDFRKFDGNAQGFRVLTKLQVLDDAYGLNLTYATLASYLKYPNPNSLNDKFLHLKKRGVYQSEREYLSKIFDACGLINDKGVFYRHPLSYLMEAADSICYRVMDIEDGFNKNWYDFEKIVESISDIAVLKRTIDKAKGKPTEISKVVTLRIGIIAYLVELAIKNFVENYDAINSGTFNEELIEVDKNKVDERLKKFCEENIFPQKEIQSLELSGDSVISGLLDYYVNFIFHENKNYRKRAVGLISNSIKRAAFFENNLGVNGKFDDLNNYYKFRVIVDFITGMTDQYALSYYQRLSGQKIR